MYWMYHEAAWEGEMPLISGSFKVNTAALKVSLKSHPIRTDQSLTSPALRSVARSEIRDRARGAIETALHSNEAQAAIAVG